MNVLLVNPYYQPIGGTEQRIAALAAEFRKRGHKTSFLVHGEPGTGNAFPDFSVCTSTSNMSRIIARKIIERDKIDLVQQHNYQNVGNGAILAAKDKKIPSVYYAHDFCSICLRRFLADGTDPDVKPCNLTDPNRCSSCVDPYQGHVHRKETEVLQSASLGVAPSKFFIDILEAHNVLKDKWVKVTPWISSFYRDFFWSGYCSNTVMFAGNLTPGKGVFTLVKALPKILKEIPDATLRCFAGGDIAPVILEAKKLNVLNHLQLSQPVPTEKLVFEYINAGVVCFPSRLQEAFGLIWAEAMTVGAPVICSRIGSIPELSQGYIPLIEPGNVDAWSEAILTVLQDRQESVKLAKTNKAWAKTIFSVEEAANEIMKQYESLIK